MSRRSQSTFSVCVSQFGIIPITIQRASQRTIAGQKKKYKNNFQKTLKKKVIFKLGE